MKTRSYSRSRAKQTRTINIKRTRIRTKEKKGSMAALTYLRKVLHQIPLTTCKPRCRDARIESLLREEDIIQAIQSRTKTTNYICSLPPPRHWYDFSFIDRKTELQYYINIKISNGGCVNAMNKKALVYTFTTLQDKEIPSTMNFNTLHKLLHTHSRGYRDPGKEYYYLYIDKKDKTVLVRSICDIEHWVSNPTNILQINWTKEKKKKDSEFVQKRQYLYPIRSRIMGHISKSLRSYVASCNSFL